MKQMLNQKATLKWQESFVALLLASGLTSLPSPASAVVFFLKINKFIYSFIFGCVGSSSLHVGFLQLRRAGATLRCSVWASHCGGFSCCGAWGLGAQASVVVARGLSSCGTRAQLLCSMWDLPRPGLKPVSPALAGRFLTTAPPGKFHQQWS